jgi:TolA-binding protein
VGTESGPNTLEELGEMTSGWNASRKAITGLLLAGIATIALPGAAVAQQDDEARIRRLESEIRALQRAVFPGGDGRYFAPEVDTSQGPQQAQPVGTPSNSALADVLARLDALEAQLARMTAREEENANEIAQLKTQLDEARVAAEANDIGETATAQRTGPIPLPAVADGGSRATTPPARAAAATPAPTPAPGPARSATPAPTPARVTAPTPTPTPARNAAATPAAPRPTAARVAAVQAIAKPATADTADDEYTYGYRLWEAGYFPEARQQLSLYLQKYPSHSRVSYARNLLGRSFLDDGQPREAATHFFENYQKDKNGARAADSLLFLSEAMVAIGDTNRACIALAEFGETYPALATGRLKEQYDRDRGKVTCRT